MKGDLTSSADDEAALIVIGGGFAGLSAASHLAAKGHHVRLFEKNESLGGRARSFSDRGFFFDMGPSWYWMPDVFEEHFRKLGSSVKANYTLQRLDPSYRVFFQEGSFDLPAGKERVAELFEGIEKGSGGQLLRFLKEAEKKYRIGMGDLVRKPSLSLLEFLDPRVIKGLFSMDLFTSLSSHIRKRFQDPRIRRILEFPILFLGSEPERIPALYSLMNHADISLGTWYPKGGMKEVVKGMEKRARELGVELRCSEPVRRIRPRDGKGPLVETEHNSYPSRATVASNDGEHVDRELLGPELARYSESYWSQRTMAPSVQLFFLGIDGELDMLEHHNLFFDRPFEAHIRSIREEKAWPEDPLFYVCAPSRSDPSVAPEGKENLFVLVPLAPGLHNSEEESERIYRRVMERLETRTGIALKERVIIRHDYGPDDLRRDHNAFQGNAYGLANTLRQTALLKPSMKSRKVEGLYFAGQTTVPGPGVPPSLISGEIVADLIDRERGRPF